MTRLEIPQIAQLAGEQALLASPADRQTWSRADAVALVLDAAGPLVVAAHLRRVAATFGADSWIAEALNEDADGLDPEGLTR